jgi:hypothetical protein
MLNLPKEPFNKYTLKKFLHFSRKKASCSEFRYISVFLRKGNVMPLEITTHAGFCMGVQRAVTTALRETEAGKSLCTLGELTHNPQVVNLLKQKGASSVDSLEAIGGRTVLIRSHGITEQTLEKLRSMGTSVILHLPVCG